LLYRVSTTSGNTENLLEFLIPPGNLLEFNWSSWKFLTDGTTTKASSHKNVSSSPVVWKVMMMMMIMYIYTYRITDLKD